MSQSMDGTTQAQAPKYSTLDSVPFSQKTGTYSCFALPGETESKPLVDVISPGVVEFLQLKESVKRKIAVDFQGHVYSDFATVAAPYAYFSSPPMQSDDLHLVVCVHGLDGKLFSRSTFETNLRCWHFSATFTWNEVTNQRYCCFFLTKFVISWSSFHHFVMSRTLIELSKVSRFLPVIQLFWVSSASRIWYFQPKRSIHTSKFTIWQHDGEKHLWLWIFDRTVFRR